jgi:hypothetical protein
MTQSFAVDQSPEEIEGATAEFRFKHKDIHSGRRKISELTPGQKGIWHVTGNRLNFVEIRKESGSR